MGCSDVNISPRHVDNFYHNSGCSKHCSSYPVVSVCCDFNPYVVSESISRSNYISFRYPVLRSSYNSVRFDGSCQCFPIVGCFNERKQFLFCNLEAERCSHYIPAVRLTLPYAQFSTKNYRRLMLCAPQIRHVHRGHHIMAVSTSHVHL